MKVGMFLERGKHVIRFICSGCGNPIENLELANFAPAEDQWDRPTKLGPGYTLITDDLEVWHHGCDDAGVPWINCLAGLKAGMSVAQVRGMAAKS